MNSKTVLVGLLVYLSIFEVKSSPHSPNTINNKKVDKITYPAKSNKVIANRDSEAEEAEPAAEQTDAAPSPPKGSSRLPHFPSWNLPHEEFKTELEKIMEPINAGLEKLMNSIHDVVHEGLNVLGGLNHDKAFITGFDPDMFKPQLAKDDEEQAAKRRKLRAKNVTKS